MKTIVFTQHPSKNYLWVHDDIQIQDIEKQQWLLTMNHESRICESIYAVIDMLTKVGLSPLFQLSEEMLNVNSMDKC